MLPIKLLYTSLHILLVFLLTGSSGNQFHHSLLFEKALDTFKIVAAIPEHSKKKSKKSHQPQVNCIIKLEFCVQ